MSISDLIDAVGPGDSTLKDTAVAELASYCSVFMNNNPLMSKCAYFKDLKAFNRTHNCNFNHWRQR